MERLQAYKFELSPTGAQAQQMRRFAGACRFVFNKALALQQENYRAGGTFIGYAAMCKRLTAWRGAAETPWLKDAPVHAQQQTLKDLERAYLNFFAKRADYPRFKRKGISTDGFRFPDPNRIKLDRENGRISLPKLGWMRYRNSRQPLGEVRSVTVSSKAGSKAGKWVVSILTRREVETPVPQGPAVGIDLGIARLATLSTGEHLAPLNALKKHAARLARYQRRMARKVKFSNNWKKAKARVQKIHTDIAHARADYLHKASTALSKNHALVCLEDLQVRNMSKSAAGTVTQPGTRVRQKAGLNKAILDQGWGEFRRQLEYKVAWRGGYTVAVPPAYTSQTCPCCGHVAAASRRSQALFGCVACGYENHADVVGAINVLERGLRLFACGGKAQSGRPGKQEPTEVTHAAVA
jgi:putative transposase